MPWVFIVLIQLLRNRVFFFWCIPYFPKDALCKVKLQHAQKHKYTGKSKTIMPAYFLTDITAQHHTQKGSTIDPHIENRISGILFTALIRI
ncbi:hypothetical protein D3C81_1416580 [compost metagenome]